MLLSAFHDYQVNAGLVDLQSQILVNGMRYKTLKYKKGDWISAHLNQSSFRFFLDNKEVRNIYLVRSNMKISVRIKLNGGMIAEEEDRVVNINWPIFSVQSEKVERREEEWIDGERGFMIYCHNI
jgi:hypothetical protein